jgi:hypothetical protein
MPTAAVQEVKEFARSGRLLSGSQSTETVYLVHDVKAALGRAIGKVSIDSAWSMTWTQIREDQSADLLVAKYALDSAERAIVNRDSCLIADAICSSIAPRLQRMGLSCLVNEVSVDLWSIATARLIQGRSNDFWERVFELYCDGLWPCGWDGPAYPMGNFVAFTSARPKAIHRKPRCVVPGGINSLARYELAVATSGVFEIGGLRSYASLIELGPQ